MVGPVREFFVLRRAGCKLFSGFLRFSLRLVLRSEERSSIETLNIMPHRMRCPLRGVYAVKVYGLVPDVVLGVASLGLRPVVQGTFELLEVHCFDFDAMVYGAKVTVVFCHFIRAEQNFDGLDALRHQIALDCQAAKAFFAKGEDL